MLDVMKADLPKAALGLKDFDARTLDDQSIEVTVRREAASTQCSLSLRMLEWSSPVCAIRPTDSNSYFSTS